VKQYRVLDVGTGTGSVASALETTLSSGEVVGSRR
jgi:ubiquinone/menaquinone biosynthesis C-methylase UbiE